MVKGTFVENVPFIKVIIAYGQSVQSVYAILDTGFTGDVQVTPQMAEELGLQVIGVTNTQIANGQIISVPTALAIASMEGANNSIQVLISDSMPLTGISFMDKFKYKATVDCFHRTVRLDRVN